MKTIRDLESRVRSYVRSFPVVFSKARGHRLFDGEGRTWIDFFAGAGALNYGHNDPRLKEALLRYLASDGIVHSLDMATDPKIALLRRFDEVILRPRNLAYRFLFPGPTGTNAVEAAMKVARKATGRTEVWAFEGGFHGMTLGSLAITSNAMKRRGAGQPLSHARLLPFDGRDSLTSLESALQDAERAGTLPAAVVLETVQCEGGVIVAGTEWLRGVERACRRAGVLLVVDDIQAGCGRTGSFFSFEEAGLRPDLVCLSKSLSGFGLPLALVLLRDELDVFEPGEHNGTFRGHNPAFVTAHAALDYWEDDALMQDVRRKGALVRERLERIAREHAGTGVTVRGRGLVQGLAFAEPGVASALSRHCFGKGLVIETAGHRDEVLKLLPPLTIEESALDRGLSIIEEAVVAECGVAATAS